MPSDSSSQAAPARRPRRTAWRCSPLVWLIVVFLSSVAVVRAGAQPATEPAQPHATSGVEGEQAEAEHSEGVVPVIARAFNFAVLAGVLYYFLGGPIAAYLASRSTQIRQDLVTAAEMRAAASAQLAQIEEKLKTLPAELDALRARGAEDVVAERERIARAAAAERDRLLAHTRREIDMQLRMARRALVEHGAQLAVDVARARIVQTITGEDQLRLVDRYVSQLKEAQ
jgi:F-type H+-transporting ATPase subunit b